MTLYKDAAIQMADETLIGRVRTLSDLELALLLCLVAKEHCIVTTDADALDNLVQELQLLCRRVFGIPAVVVNCTATTTLDDFASAILLCQPSPTRAPSAAALSISSSHAGPVGSSSSGAGPSNRRSPSPLLRPLAVSSASSHSTRHHQRTGSGPRDHQQREPLLLPLTPINARAASGLQSQQPPLSGKAYSHQGDGAQITIAPIILARNLDAAPRAVQIQALELLRTRRIFTRTSVQTAPKKAFLFVAVLARDGELGEDDNDEEDEETGDGQRRRSRLEAVDGDAGMGKGRTGRVTRHLNDHFFLSHHHDSVEEGFPNLDEAERRRAKKTRSRARDEGKGKGKERQSVGDDVETASTDSVVVKKSVVDGSDSSSSDDDGALHPKKGDEFGSYGPDSSDSSDDRDGGLFTESDISFLAQLARRAHIDSDVARYAANIISFLRLHRAVAGGVSPLATRHLDLLARCLAPLNGLDFVTPSLVAIAARKVYPHRIDLVSAPSAAGSGLINGRAATATAVEERSLQWGSDSAAVQAVLAGVEPEDVIEDVLSIVAAPL